MANEQSTWSPPQPAPLSIGKGTAELGEIVVFIDGRTETTGILEFAGTLAQEQGARLISVFIQPEPAATLPEMFARGEGILEVIEVHQAQTERIEAKHRAQFEDFVRRHEIRSEWRSLPYLSSELGVHAYYADLVLIAPPGISGADGWPSWPRGVPGPQLRSADHRVSTTRDGIPGSPYPRGVERHARVHPGRRRRPAIACEGRGGRGPGGRPSG